MHEGSPATSYSRGVGPLVLQSGSSQAKASGEGTEKNMVGRRGKQEAAGGEGDGIRGWVIQGESLALGACRMVCSAH